jgi:aldose 1-epimerase
MIVEKKIFGVMPDKREAMLFKFITCNGLEVSISNYGGIITSIKAPDRYGQVREITAGFPTLDQYLKGHPYFGAIAGRYANRIGGGRFSINGNYYTLSVNNGENHLHGGNIGLDKKLWHYHLTEYDDKAVLELEYLSPHMEEGYPGNLKAGVIYSIGDDNEISVSFTGETDMATHLNMTSHCYFNLSGFADNIYDHKLMLNSSAYLETDEQGIPSGEILSLENSSFDFRRFKKLGEAIPWSDGGLDHCFVIDKSSDSEMPAAVVTHDKSGRRLTIYTTQPGVQVYTGNYLDGTITGHNSTVYSKHCALCIEPQHFPDSPNHPEFPPTLLASEEKYFQKIRFVFGTDE